MTHSLFTRSVDILESVPGPLLKDNGNGPQFRLGEWSLWRHRPDTWLIRRGPCNGRSFPAALYCGLIGFYNDMVDGTVRSEIGAPDDGWWSIHGDSLLYIVSASPMHSLQVEHEAFMAKMRERWDRHVKQCEAWAVANTGSPTGRWSKRLPQVLSGIVSQGVNRNGDHFPSFHFSKEEMDKAREAMLIEQQALIESGALTAKREMRVQDKPIHGPSPIVAAVREFLYGKSLVSLIGEKQPGAEERLSASQVAEWTKLTSEQQYALSALPFSAGYKALGMLPPVLTPAKSENKSSSVADKPDVSQSIAQTMQLASDMIQTPDPSKDTGTKYAVDSLPTEAKPAEESSGDFFRRALGF